MRASVSKAPPNKSVDKNTGGMLNLTALQQTPGFMIRILQIQIFEEFFSYFSSLGISPAEHSSLIVIRDNPWATQSEIAGALRIQLPNFVKILLKLEADGLIKRRRSSKDKRAVELTLTAKGEGAARQASEMAKAFNRLTLSPLNESKQQQFLQMLTQLVHAGAKSRSL